MNGDYDEYEALIARRARNAGKLAGLREAAEIAEAFPARTHGALATAPYAAAEQAAEEIAAAILARIAELEKERRDDHQN